MTTLPSIDLASSNAPQALDAVCREHGFFYLVNHGVSDALFAAQFSQAQALFALPQARLESLNNIHSKSLSRGYFSLEQEKLLGNDSTRDLSEEREVSQHKNYRGDRKEGFDYGTEFSAADADFDKALVGPNLWPDPALLPEFHAVARRYIDAMYGVARQLLRAFAIALGQRADYFEDKIKRPMHTQRMLHYPALGSSKAAQVGAGAHTDYGCFTLLKQDQIGGLWIRPDASDWVAVPPRPEALVVNIGDMMARWTNGEYASTVHRVDNHQSQVRYSLPYFFNPDYETMVANLRPDSQAKWPPETCGEILSARYAQTF